MRQMLHDDAETPAVSQDMADYMAVQLAQVTYCGHGQTHALVTAANGALKGDLLGSPGLTTDLVVVAASKARIMQRLTVQNGVAVAEWALTPAPFPGAAGGEAETWLKLTVHTARAAGKCFAPRLRWPR
jgi:hypothetical protein